MSVKKEYPAGDLTVVWKPELCAHAAECVKGLPNVFKPDDKPWIQTAGASTADLKATIDKCPSGALSYYMASNVGATSSVPEQVPVTVIAGGPLIVEQSVAVTLADGSVIERKKKCSFCRCGASANKPFCDGAHRNISFE